ncbi:tyrosine-type recombinase/integrase [Actinomycetospora sp. CA-101289]|uniref:tyrosine-type recombinase/integrase n=1 Tax=Actinomycetospora sp. CA-101289 TaxID=3239893 RepID=UPI003D99EB13
MRTERYGHGSRWLVRSRDPDGSQRKKAFRRKTDAEGYAASVEHDMRSGSYIDPTAGRLLTGEWARDWLAAQGHLTPSTYDRYRGAIENYIVPRWATTRLSSVRHAEVQKWVTQLGATLSPSSVDKVHRVFSQVMAWAVTDDRITKNPAAGIRIRRPALPDHRYLDHASVALLAKACENYAPLVRLLAYTGLRWGEAAALRVRRVDLGRRRLAVAESVTEVSGRLVWGAPKSHARRTVPLPRFLVSDLEPLVEGKSADDLVFTAPAGGVLRGRNFRRNTFDPAVRLVGPAGFHPHELRHTAASLAIASGADVKVVQQMLGHKTATLTLDLYGHLFPDRLDDLADRMDAAVSAPDVPHEGEEDD